MRALQDVGEFTCFAASPVRIPASPGNSFLSFYAELKKITGRLNQKEKKKNNAVFVIEGSD